ncbi:MAG: hypothetical protein Q9227_000754 [Pyrenula ochraceoflavens]
MYILGRRKRAADFLRSAWTLGMLLIGHSLPASADKSAGEYFVRSLPGQPDGPLLKMHAGHIEVDHDSNANLWFWHFKNRHIANKQRTVLWLNGGPGCSSMDGALMEIGPYRLQDDHTLRYNDGSWDEFANLLFVDNPVGTGYSYVNGNAYLHELPEMAAQMVTFLEKFFGLFPEYEMDDIYIAGESYAGQHIPHIARAILDRNKEAGKTKWNVAGLLIGNGWISPPEQYQAYLSFAYQADLLQGGSEKAKDIEGMMSRCNNELSKPGAADKVDVGMCEGILNEILSVTRKDDGSCYNMYDVRLTDSFPSCGMNWPPDLKDVTPYLRKQEVVDALHVNPDKRTGWTECSGAVGGAFSASDSMPSIDLLPALLEDDIPIALFSGDQDFICNHLGTEEFINNMEWSGAKGFESSPGVWAPKRDWTFEGEPAGLYQEARNLTYILFYNSSHMVPFDYPRRTRDMLDRFMGVDIASIGGKPVDSQIDGEKAGTETSVGGHPNSTAATETEKEKLKDAEWHAYYKSGEVALVIVAIAAAVWGFFVWRARRRARRLGPTYQGVPNHSNGDLGGRFRSKVMGRDLEAADFDEAELDDLHADDDHDGRHDISASSPYDLGDDSSDDEREKGLGAHGKVSRPLKKGSG